MVDQFLLVRAKGESFGPAPRLRQGIGGIGGAMLRYRISRHVGRPTGVV